MSHTMMHKRAAVEAPEPYREWKEKFRWLLSAFRMVPGGRSLHAIGNPNKVTALNCYVVSAPHDSLQGIYHTIWELAETLWQLQSTNWAVSTCRRLS